MDATELEAMIEQLDAMYSRLWDEGHKDAANKIDEVTDILWDRLVELNMGVANG